MALKLVLGSCLFASAVALNAQPTSPGTPAPPPNNSAHKVDRHDPNEVVCEVQQVLGSRIAARKVCATRAEWAAQRGDDRDGIDRLQRNPRRGGE